MQADTHIIIPRLSAFVRGLAKQFATRHEAPFKDSSISSSFNRFVTAELNAVRVSPVIYRPHNAEVGFIMCHGYYIEWATPGETLCFALENDVEIKRDIYWCFP